MGEKEKIPGNIGSRLRSKGIDPEAIKISARSDLSKRGYYRKEWIGATRETLYILRDEDREHGEQPEEELRSIPVQEIEELKAESLVSSEILTARMGGAEHILCRFSNTCARDFSRFVRAFKKLKAGETLTDEDSGESRRSAICPKCGLRYPDPNRTICPKCLDKRSLFLRVLSYVPRYRAQILLMLACMIASSVLNLFIPFLGGKVFFDQVLSENGKYHGKIIEVILLMAGTQILSRLVAIAYGRTNAAVAARVIFDLKKEIFTAMQRLSP